MKRSRHYSDSENTENHPRKRRKFSPPLSPNSVDYSYPPPAPPRARLHSPPRYNSRKYSPSPQRNYDPRRRRRQNFPEKRSSPSRHFNDHRRRNYDYYNGDRYHKGHDKTFQMSSVNERDRQNHEYLKNRKKQRDKISSFIVSKEVFSKSPERKLISRKIKGVKKEIMCVYNLLELEEEDLKEKEKQEKNLEKKRNKSTKVKTEKQNELFKKEFEQRLMLENQAKSSGIIGTNDKNISISNDDNGNKKQKIVGPKKLEEFEKEMAFHGEKLLPGEGEAMSKFLSTGKRIPRRGELLSEERIKELETLGYVMSGNRHKRMSEVRKQKEEAVKNIYEKYLLDYEKFMERQKKEVQIRSKLRKLVVDQKNKDNI